MNDKDEDGKKGRNDQARNERQRQKTEVAADPDGRVSLHRVSYSVSNVPPAWLEERPSTVTRAPYCTEITRPCSFQLGVLQKVASIQLPARVPCLLLASAVFSTLTRAPTCPRTNASQRHVESHLQETQEGFLRGRPISAIESCLLTESTIPCKDTWEEGDTSAENLYNSHER